MRVVLTIHHFPPNYSAGAEVYAFRLAGWLVGQGHEVEVVCVESITHAGGFSSQHDMYEGISVWRLYYNLAEAPDPFRQTFDNPMIGRWFTGFLQQVQPDVVHVNSCYLLSVSTIAATTATTDIAARPLHIGRLLCQPLANSAGVRSLSGRGRTPTRQSASAHRHGPPR